MRITVVVVDLLLTLLLLASAALKLTRRPEVIASYQRVGVASERLPLLAGILILGALGLLAGLWWPPLGIAAAAGLTAYFALAIVAHVRHHDLAHAGPPTVLLALSAAALVMIGIEA